MRKNSTLLFRLPLLFILYFLLYYVVEWMEKGHVLSYIWGTRIQIGLLVVYFFVLMGIMILSAKDSIKR